MATFRILTWNLENKSPTHRPGRLAVEHLLGQTPDVMVLTEASTRVGSAVGEAGEAHVVWSRPLPTPKQGPAPRPHFRRVVLWSRRPWEEVDALGTAALPAGRFAAGVTETK